MTGEEMHPSEEDLLFENLSAEVDIGMVAAYQHVFVSKQILVQASPEAIL